jgi:hypothetical protein
MRYAVYICNNHREAKQFYGLRNVLECFLLSFPCSEIVGPQAVLFENRFSEGPLICVQPPVANREEH